MSWDRNKTLVVVATGIGLAAVILFVARSGEEGVADREVLDSVGDSTVTVKCEQCQHVRVMPAVEFLRGTDVGDSQLVKCAQCGKRTASRAEVVLGHPSLEGFDGSQYTTVAAVEAALRELKFEISATQAELAKPEVASDAARKQSLDLKLQQLYVRRGVLDARWDALESEHTAAP